MTLSCERLCGKWGRQEGWRNVAVPKGRGVWDGREKA